jgi:antitoxin (DNA-binding transcriptional repressor) of toxin-antitoxin stability system
MEVTVRVAKNALSRYGNVAHDGERVVVTRHGRPWFDLTPHRKVTRRTTPLPGVKPTVSIEQAIAPLDEKDLPGWT